jgi:glyoxylase-like metal-dependent hydrolase (beta-lactamase superfamily II)
VIPLPQEILPGLFRIEIPLPDTPLKTLNSYVVTGSARTLVVDTGFNRPECLAAMRRGLQELAVDPAGIDLFITHLHSDHVGLAATLAAPAARIWCSAADARDINTFIALSPTAAWRNDRVALACRHGFPPAEAAEAFLRHPGFRLAPERQLAFTAVAAGDEITAGPYRFTCLATPGHTQGHMCLYEPRAKILLSGDHLLRDITPNISHWREAGDPLADYLASLERVAALDVGLVLPGHRRLFTDCRARAEELVAHHRSRAAEVASLLTGGPLTAYQVAAGMKWDMTYRRWDDFPPPQKWFAVGEAIAHLRYLQGLGTVSRREQQGLILYN